MRVAIVHYWLLNMRGGERVIEALCRLFPEADLFTLFYDPDRVSETIRRRRVTVSFLNPLRRYYRSLLPLMPLALERFDLGGYDLVISSESGPAKGVLAPAAARHICYCHTPMRYLWELYPAYLTEWTPRWKALVMAPLASWLRVWDYAAAARVDQFVANSRNVQRRIRRAWRREATVIYPPVRVEQFYSKPPEDYDLVVSELVPYKRVDVAARWYSRSGRRLRIVGEGPEYARLKRLAGRSVEFCGRVSDEALRELYARCRALVMPGEEDFGLAPVEALASGKPVVALGRGGVLESVPLEKPFGGVFFDQPDEEALGAAVRALEAREKDLDPAALRAYATRFSEEEFLRRMKALVDAGGADVRT